MRDSDPLVYYLVGTPRGRLSKLKARLLERIRLTKHTVIVRGCRQTFYDFPAQQRPHLRTTNPIESTFATVRLRTYRTKGLGSRIATLSCFRRNWKIVS